MASVFNLGDVLELVNDSFHDGTLAQEQFVHEWQEAILHIFAEFGDELNGVLVEQQSRQGCAEIALVAEEFPKQTPTQGRKGNAVIHIASAEGHAQQFAPVIGEQMHFEAVEPTHASLSSHRQASEDFVSMNTMIIADGQSGAVNETDARAASIVLVQVGPQHQQHAGHEFHKSVVAHQFRKLPAQVTHDITCVECLEVPKTHLMKVNEDGHDFALVQMSRSSSHSPIAQL